MGLRQLECSPAPLLQRHRVLHQCSEVLWSCTSFIFSLICNCSIGDSWFSFVSLGGLCLTLALGNAIVLSWSEEWRVSRNLAAGCKTRSLPMLMIFRFFLKRKGWGEIAMWGEKCLIGSPCIQISTSIWSVVLWNVKNLGMVGQGLSFSHKPFLCHLENTGVTCRSYLPGLKITILIAALI